MGFLLTLSWIPSGKAQVREEGASVHSMGMGDAVRSNAFSSNALYFNPSGMSVVPIYNLEAGYDFVNTNTTHVVIVSVIDSQTNQALSGGFGYSYIHSMLPDEVKRTGHSVRFALSTGYRSEQFGIFFGLGVRYLKIDIENVSTLNMIAADLGTILTTSFGLQFGIVGHNLTSIKTEEAPRSLGLGLSYINSGFVLGFDALLDFQTKEKVKAQYNFGTEYLIYKMVSVRAGFQMDKIHDQNRVTCGLGYFHKYFGLDIAYMQDIGNKSNYFISTRLHGFLP